MQFCRDSVFALHRLKIWRKSATGITCQKYSVHMWNHADFIDDTVEIVYKTGISGSLTVSSL